jgi:hypothetical protein
MTAILRQKRSGAASPIEREITARFNPEFTPEKS